MVGKRSKIMALLLSLLFALTIGLGAAGALTEDDFGTAALDLVEKLQALDGNKNLALEAVTIAQGVVENDSILNSILEPEQRTAIADLGLSKQDVSDVMTTAKSYINDNFDGLVSGNVLSLISFYNTVKEEVDPTILGKLSDAGVTETQLINTAVDLANSTYDPYEAIPREDIEKIFNDNSPVSEEVANKYGLNYTNVENLRQYLLDTNNLDTFKSILQELSLYDEPSDDGGSSPGGGGGGGPVSDPTDPDESADQAEDTVSDPDATDDEVADSTDHAADSLDGAADSAETSEEAEKVADTASEFSGTLVKAADRVQDPDAAGKVGDAAATVVSSLAKTAGKVTTEEGMNKVADAASKTMDAASKAMDKMDAEKAQDIAGKMIESIATLNETLKGQEAKTLAQKAGQLAQKAVDRAGTDKLSGDEVTVEGDKASAVANPERIREKAQAAVKAAREMSESMQEAGLKENANITTKVAIEVPATGKEQVETTLPAGTLDALADSKVDALEVKTEVANITVSPDAFGDEAKGKDISLGAAKVDRKDIPESVKKDIPSNSVVVDLNASVGGEKVSKFKKPVEAAIPYTLGENENPNEVSVFLLTDDGKLKKVGGKYDPVTGTVKFKTSHFSKYFAKTSRTTFADLNKFDWAKDTIEIMAGKGYVAGRTASTFDPGADITRAEFSALVVRILALPESDGSELPFKDVAKGAWYRDVVATAYANNIVAGKAADVFDPNGKITRQEMAVIISRIMTAEGFKPGDISELDSFTDEGQIADWARDGAALAVREGIVSGMPGGKFAPEEKANRAQAAVMLYRLFDKL